MYDYSIITAPRHGLNRNPQRCRGGLGFPERLIERGEREPDRAGPHRSAVLITAVGVGGPGDRPEAEKELESRVGMAAVPLTEGVLVASSVEFRAHSLRS